MIGYYAYQKAMHSKYGVFVNHFIMHRHSISYCRGFVRVWKVTWHYYCYHHYYYYHIYLILYVRASRYHLISALAHMLSFCLITYIHFCMDLMIFIIYAFIDNICMYAYCLDLFYCKGMLVVCIAVILLFAQFDHHHLFIGRCNTIHHKIRIILYL